MKRPVGHHSLRRPLRHPMSATLITAATLICTVAVAGCGGNDEPGAAQVGGTASPSPTASPTPGLAALPAAQISEKARRALLRAPSLTMTVKLRDKGDLIRTKLSLDNKGHCIGRATVPGLGSFVILKSRKRLFAKVGTDMWRLIGGREAAQLFRGKYLKVPRNDPNFKVFSSVCDLDTFTAEFAKAKGAKHITKRGTATVHGVPTVVLSQRDKGGKVLVYVAAEGTPYPVKIVDRGGKDAGSVRFSDFGKPVTVRKPPAKDVIDLSKLNG